MHYLKFAIVIVAAAHVDRRHRRACCSATGVVNVYHRFFRFPELIFHPNWPMFGVAFLVSAGAALLGVIGAVRQAVRLPPAEAMRPGAARGISPSLLRAARAYASSSSTSFRMALRNLERKPWQAFFTAFGLALATGIPIVPGAMRDGIDYLLSLPMGPGAAAGCDRELHRTRLGQHARESAALCRA